MGENLPTEAPGGAEGQGTGGRLQVLATEHWSLLATRALTFNESMSRVTIFLSILSGALIALALVAQADHFGVAFISIAIPMLSVVVFTGVATIGRLMALNRDDHRWVVGMNRLRNGYLQLYPDLAPHFMASQYDDLPGALQTLGIEQHSAGRRVGSPFHLLLTLPGMLSVIVATLAGAVTSIAALAFAGPPLHVILAGAGGFVLAMALLGTWQGRSFKGADDTLAPRFPLPRLKEAAVRGHQGRW